MKKRTCKDASNEALCSKNYIDLTDKKYNTETKASSHSNTPKQRKAPHTFTSCYQSETKSI